MSVPEEFARVLEICQAAAEEAKVKAENQCRLASMEDFYYDTGECKYWCRTDAKLYDKEAVNAMIPKTRWLLVTEAAKRGLADPEPEDDDDDPGADKAPKRRRGRPKNKLIEPHKVIQRVEFGHHIHSATYWPGEPLIIKDWAANEGGFERAAGNRLFNTYREPPEFHGDPTLATPWIDHVKRLWPNPIEHEYFFKYMAHMVQHPEEKCNVAIVMSGVQGIGKDAALAPVKHIIGQWNARGIDPDQVLEPFRPWLETLLLTIDEVRPNKDESRASSFYNQLKTLIATPPDTIALNQKFVKLRYVRNVMRVILTTNDRYALFIPQDDRRIFMMHSLLESNWHVKQGMPEYFESLFRWFDINRALLDQQAPTGVAHVAAYLNTLSLSNFNPKAEPPKTISWKMITGSWGEPDDLIDEAMTALARQEQVLLKNPIVATEEGEQIPKLPIFFGWELEHIKDFSPDHEHDIKGLLQQTRKLTHRMQTSGYDLVRPTVAKKWKFKKKCSDGKDVFFESSYAFALPSNDEEGKGGWDALQERVRERGRLIVERMAASREAELKGEKQAPEPPNNVFHMPRP